MRIWFGLILNSITTSDRINGLTERSWDRKNQSCRTDRDPPCANGAGATPHRKLSVPFFHHRTVDAHRPLHEIVCSRLEELNITGVSHIAMHHGRDPCRRSRIDPAALCQRDPGAFPVSNRHVVPTGRIGWDAELYIMIFRNNRHNRRFHRRER